MEKLSKKGKELMEMDNREVIAMGKGHIRGLNGNEKNIIKIIY